MARVSDVFIAGGEPKVTYNPRSNLRLEDGIRDYLEDRHQLLSISGPTKFGKTVLVRKVISKGAEVAKDAQMSYAAHDVSTQKPTVSFQAKQAH